MVLDTSALVAVLFNEPERAAFAAAIEADPVRLVSAGSLLECSVLVEARRGEVAGRELELMINRAELEIVPFDAVQLAHARRGWRRFGRGRHSARLNFGDLYAYGLSISTGEPLLFKGDDFAKTDITSVVSR